MPPKRSSHVAKFIYLNFFLKFFKTIFETLGNAKLILAFCSFEFTCFSKFCNFFVIKATENQGKIPKNTKRAKKLHFFLGNPKNND